MESRCPEDSKNVKTSQAYFFEVFISFSEDFSLTIGISFITFLALTIVMEYRTTMKNVTCDLILDCVGTIFTLIVF